MDILYRQYSEKWIEQIAFVIIYYMILSYTKNKLGFYN